MGGEERRDVLPESLPDVCCESRGTGDGERGRRQVSDVGPAITRSLRRSGVRERRHPPLIAPGGDLREGSGDLARGVGLSLSYNGDLDLPLSLVSI